MSLRFPRPVYFLFIFPTLASWVAGQPEAVETETTKVWQLVELEFEAETPIENPYTDVRLWVDLHGPDYKKRVTGFWDGGRIFKVRIVATQPGRWTWTLHSNRPSDRGLNGRTGSFVAEAWTWAEILQNPNRRGFVRPTPNGRALQYADGMPFFLLGDTFWAASTWRYPLTGRPATPDWEPGPEALTFENIVHFRKRQGYNSIAMIASFPNWHADPFPAQHTDADGVGVRQAWEFFGTNTAKAMHDEVGNIPFEMSDEPPVADYRRINPKYFQSLDRKMAYLSENGFVPVLETIRRDHGPSMKKRFDWPDVLVRYIDYIVARYGAWNIIFSPIHLDWIPPVHSLSAAEFNTAIKAWHAETGGLPFGQPVTVLIDRATHTTFGGHLDVVPWLTMHSVGNTPRNHGMYPLIEEQFRLDPPVPTANLEPYYPGWNSSYHNNVAGEIPVPGGPRDNYFGRAQAWGSVLSGGLAGHVFGTGAYDGTTVGEPAGSRPYIWEALQYPAGAQMQALKSFMLSEGAHYQDLRPAGQDIRPRHAKTAKENGLDGWSFMMRSPDRSLAMLYFENRAEIPGLHGFSPDTEYVLAWFHPVEGAWFDPIYLESDGGGNIQVPAFPDGSRISDRDWALKIKLR